MARFCFECWHNWLAGFWKFKDVFIFNKGGWSFPSPNDKAIEIEKLLNDN
jgi:hypothetical protein